MSAINEFKKLLAEAAESQKKIDEHLQEEESIVNKTARYLQTKNDDVPAQPKDIESQRWNDPLRPVDQEFVTLKQMNDHYGLLLQRIQQQMSTFGGGGEVNLRNLDDVDSSSIGPNKHLAYNPTTRKFFFESVSGSEPQVQSDWNEADSENVAFINNKPPVSYDGVNNDVIIESGNSLVVSDEIRKDSGNLSILTDNYLILDSTNNGQIEIGRNSGLGNVLIGNKANGTDISIFGDVLFSGSNYKADFAGSDIENVNNMKTIQSIEFDTTHDISTHEHDVGTLCWNNVDETLNLYQPNGVIHQVGQELFAFVRNDTGSTIPNGAIVKLAGAEQTPEPRLEVSMFLADGSVPSVRFIGVATEDIVDGTNGRIAVWGKVREINASGNDLNPIETWNVGDTLYAHPTNAGKMTKIKPTTPSNVIPVGTVLNNSSTEGEIFVKPLIDQRFDYATISSTETQELNAADTAQTITFDTIQNYLGMDIDNNDASKIVFDQSGLYTINVNAQVLSTNASKKTVYFWFRKNGTDIPFSTRIKSITGSNTYSVLHVTYNVSVNGGDDIQIMWAGDDSNLELEAGPSLDFAPASQSVYVHIDQSAL